MASGHESLGDNLRSLGIKGLLPHDTRHTTCPPAPLVSREGPVIIVASIMRSGTHLLLDSIINNIPALRRTPLFIDFDAYARRALPPGPLGDVHGTIIKTHYPHTALADPYAATLARLASRAIILAPCREPEAVRRSLAKWGQIHSAAEFAEIKNRFDAFWRPFDPVKVDFQTLLEARGIESLMREVAKRGGFQLSGRKQPVMPATSRLKVYCDKILTRILGQRAPRSTQPSAIASLPSAASKLPRALRVSCATRIHRARGATA